MLFRLFQSQPFVQILDDGVAHIVEISTFKWMVYLKEELLRISKIRYALLWTGKKEKSKLWS